MKNQSPLLAKYWLNRLEETAENSASLSSGNTVADSDYFSSERDRLLREFIDISLDDELAGVARRQNLM